jgi:hypothetical protein
MSEGPVTLSLNAVAWLLPGLVLIGLSSLASHHGAASPLMHLSSFA